MTADEMLGKIINGSPIPSFVLDRQHKVIHWNPAIESLSGIKARAIIGTDEQWKAFYREKRPVMADLIIDKASLEEIKVYYKEKFEKSSLIEGAYEAEDFFQPLGEGGRWLNFTASPIKNHEGEIICAIETLQDVTERKRAQSALYVSEKNFRELFEGALEAIWVQDLEGQIKMINRAAAKLTGYSMQELHNITASSFLDPQGQSRVAAIQEKLLNNQKVDMPYQLRLITKSGTDLIVELTTRLITQNGMPVAIQMSARDVTSEQKIQESRRTYLQQIIVAQEEERKRIACDLHDNSAQSLLLLIRRLDTVISTHDLDQSDSLKEELIEVQTQATKILNEIKQYAHELRPAILDDLGLKAALEWLADNVIADYGIEVDVRFDIVSDYLSHGAQVALFRIAQEAIANIKRHSCASRAAIELGIVEGKVRMVIQDDGKGFQLPFRLGELSNIGKLGLIGMQERAQLIDGTMNVYSELGNGTIIEVFIPLTTA